MHKFLGRIQELTFLTERNGIAASVPDTMGYFQSLKQRRFVFSQRVFLCSYSKFMLCSEVTHFELQY